METILDNPELIITSLTAILGLIAAVYENIRKRNYAGALQNVLDYLDYNSSAETAPVAIRNADASGRCINTLDADDLKIILASCRDEVERQTVRQYITVQENSGAYSYQVATSGHTYTVEQGFIKYEPVSVVALPRDANGGLVATAELVQAPLSSGKPYKADLLVGSEEQLTVRMLTYGNLIIGTFWDGKPCGQSTVTTTVTGQEKPIRFRLPQYLDAFTSGEHTLTIKFGYYAGHDDVQGDMVKWFEESEEIVTIEQ